MKAKRRAFTLVELLIVIVVIGVLAAMMMLSSTEAVESAKVAAVISNMRNLKTAITAWYLDNLDKIERSDKGIYRVMWGGKVAPVQEFWESRTTAQGMESIRAEILRYMDRGGSVSRTATGWDSNTRNQKLDDAIGGGYVLEDNGYDNPQKREQWFIGYAVKGNTRMKERFAARAKSVGLLQSNKRDSQPYTNGDIVWMRILSFEEI